VDVREAANLLGLRVIKHLVHASTALGSAECDRTSGPLALDLGRLALRVDGQDATDTSAHLWGSTLSSLWAITN
jgi:hypothetical protein